MKIFNIKFKKIYAYFFSLFLNYKSISFIFIIFILMQNIVSAAPVAKIGSVEFPNEKRIYYGPLLDNQSRSLKFYLTNLVPSNPLIMDNKAPTFINTNSPNSSGNDFFSFKVSNPTTFPILLNNHKPTDTLTIDFTTEIQTEFGRKEIMLILGLTTMTDTINTVICDTFYLIGKKTKLAIDGYDDILTFDSVFIDQNTPISLEWKVKNTTNSELEAFQQNYQLVSQYLGNEEFNVENKQFPIKFYPGSIDVYNSWICSYLPKDILPDTALVSLLFYPDNSNKKIVDTAKVMLCGTGVKHELKIVQADCDYINAIPDTIDFGYVQVNSRKSVNVKLQNCGNINYGIKSQYISEVFSESPVKYFEISKDFLSDKEKDELLTINDTASFTIDFIPDKKGTFLAKYTINNNFQDRKIRSSTINNYQKTIILKGIGVSSELKCSNDTINFGNLSYSNSENCPSTKDTIIKIYNIGNSTLLINNIYSDNKLFSVDKTSFEILPNESADLKVTFNAVYPAQQSSANLSFETNETKNSTEQIVLIGNSIPPIEAKLSIPTDLKCKPGSLLTVPLLLTNELGNINQYIQTFDIVLSYNPTLLEFVNITKLGTASESCNINYSMLSEQDIELKSYDIYNNFTNLDTLLFITFKTFLGNHANTEIAIKNAKIGNMNCDDFIKLNIENGKYSIDSICGLQYKIQQNLDEYIFKIENQTNNTIEIKFKLPYNIQSKLIVTDLFGKEIFIEKYNESTNNTITKNISTQNLNSGIYFINLTSGLYNKTIPIIIQK